MGSPVHVQWGIEPVPERLRVLGLGDTMLLWGNLAVSLLVIVLRSRMFAPLAVLAGLFGAMVAYWAWFVFGKKYANDADGK